MTARSKVTLVEAAQVRAKLIAIVYVSPDIDTHAHAVAAVDVLLEAGVIDTDAALKLVSQELSNLG